MSQEVGARYFSNKLQPEDTVFLVFPSELDASNDMCFVTVEGDDTELSRAFREDVLRRFPAQFPEGLSDSIPPATRGQIRAEHRIYLEEGARPVRVRDYRRGDDELAAMKKLLGILS